MVRAKACVDAAKLEVARAEAANREQVREKSGAAENQDLEGKSKTTIKQYNSADDSVFKG